MTDAADLVRRSLGDDARSEFDRRVGEQADRLADALRSDRLDSPGFAVGIELEAYVVDWDGRLAPAPDAVFEERCEPELGQHNVEFHTDPDPLGDDGLAAQVEQLRQGFERAREAADREGREIVLDAMWTLPPSEGTEPYLGAVREHGGVSIAEHMTASPRYYAIDNDVLARTGGAIELSVPGVERRFPSILFESLASSVQPHVQIPDTDAFPDYYNAAIRTLGPVLALATNSPLLPPDLYDDDAAADPHRLLDDTYHELRVPVFEQSINRAWEKVRFPTGVRDAAETIDRLVADPACAPFLREWLVDGERETFADRFWEIAHKRGTYWRWLRAVVGGQPVGGGNEWSLRIEYRPLPTQPTVVENVGLQCLVAGLLRGLVSADHPLAELDRDAAERCFYNAVREGPDADLAWVTADGERTADPDAVYEELFEFARRGLRESGVSREAVEKYLAPIEARRTDRTVPSRWKLTRVRDRLDDGEVFAEAVHGMQREYVRRAGTGEPLVEWD
jgi:hypothetical protein